MERSLVTAQIHVNILIRQTFPQVNNVANICHGNRTLFCYSLADSRNEFVKIAVKFIYPSLVKALFSCQWIDLCHHAHGPCNITCFGLGTRHSSKTRTYKQRMANSYFTGSVKNGDGSTVNDTLGTYIHIAAGCHLSILAHTECIVAFPIIGF